MINYTPTPDFYNDYIQHFNPFHDPRNGQFTNGRGGGSGLASRSLNKKAEAKRIAQDNQDMFNDILYRNKYGKNKIEKKQAMKDFKKAVSEISKEYAVPNNIVKKYAKRGFEDRERYIEDSKKQAENSNKIVDASLKGTRELEKELASQFLSKRSGADSYAKKQAENSNKIVDASLKGTRELEKELASQFLSKRSGADSYAKKQAENSNKIAGADFDGDGARVAKQKVKDLNKDIKKVYKVAGSDFDGDGAIVAKQKIDNEVKRARKTGMYNMEFLERNLDLDPETETQLKGKALDDAYRKFLEDELKKNNK